MFAPGSSNFSVILAPFKFGATIFVQVVRTVLKRPHSCTWAVLGKSQMPTIPDTAMKPLLTTVKQEIFVSRSFVFLLEIKFSET